jgi:hypothetical protein
MAFLLPLQRLSLVLPSRRGAYSPRGAAARLKRLLASAIRQGRETPGESEEFGIEDQL